MRKIVVAPLLALVLTIPTAGSALAIGSGGTDVSRSGHSSSAAKGGRTDVDRHSKPKQVRFAGVGTVTSVDPDGETLTLTFRKGSSKGLRGRSVEVAVTAATRIRRNGAAADLSDVLVGDRVNVEGARTGSTYLAVRISAKGAEAVDDVPAPEPSVLPTPDPTLDPTPSPPATT